MNSSINAVLLSLNFLIVLWTLFYKKLLPLKQLMILSTVLSLIILGGLGMQAENSIYFILCFFILQYFFIKRYLSNWLSPAIFILMEYSMVILVWSLTYAIPMRLFSRFLIDNGIKIVLLGFLQCSCTLILAIILKKLDEKYEVVRSLKELRSAHYQLGIILMPLIVLLGYVHILVSIKSDLMPLVLILALMVIVSLFLTTLISVVNKNYQVRKYMDFLNHAFEEERKNFELAREYRHDLKGILIGLKQLISEKEYERADLYLNELLVDSEKYLEDYQYSNLRDIKNSEIRGALFDLVGKCKKSGINLELVVEDSGKDIRVATIDLVRILSIVLTNAYEASIESEEKYIGVLLINGDFSLTLNVKNSFKDKIEISDILSKGYSSKGEGRGIGLSNLKKIVVRHPRIELSFANSRKYFNVNMDIQH